MRRRLVLLVATWLAGAGEATALAADKVDDRSARNLPATRHSLSRKLVAASEQTKVQAERSGASAGAEAAGMTFREGSPSLSEADQSAHLASPYEKSPGAGRIWGLTLGFESHAALVQTQPDDTRSRPAKAYNYFVLTPAFYPTRYDQFRAELAAFEFFTADPNESGLRLADFLFGYTRLVPIGTETAAAPWVPPMRGLLLRLEGDLTAPTSYDVTGTTYKSQLHSVITVPRLRVYAERAFLDRTLVVGANTYGEYYVVKYRTADGGGANPLSRIAFEVTADYALPMWRPLSFGVLGETLYTWYYGIDSSPPPVNGVVGDPQFTNQPVQQLYYVEAHAHYSFPAWHEIKSSASIAYDIGDNSVLHDGVQHLYFAFYRRASEVYATLSARY